MVLITMIIVLLALFLSQRCTCQEKFKMLVEEYKPRKRVENMNRMMVEEYKPRKRVENMNRMMVEEYKPRKRVENMTMIQPAIDEMRNTVADKIDDFVENTIRPQ
jgi:hypothetical protein